MKIVGSSALEICDGMGSYKVFNRMANYKITLEKFGEVDLCNYVNLNENDKLQVLKMRNHSEVRKWMYSQDSISKIDHFNFIKSLESDIDRCYFLIKQKEIIIGSVNFANIRSNKLAVFGFYANPFEKILGAGRILELTSLHFIFRELNLSKLTLEVFSDNKQVVNLHKKFGFEIVSEKNKNGKKVFCMELSQRAGNESSY
jgi:UDP-4-amino-4,6-dideoxy-N-acetyl-beta-L-altrosamine N-acetyltransferase